MTASLAALTLQTTFGLSQHESDVATHCLLVADGEKLQDLARKLGRRGVPHSSMVISALKKKGVVDRDKEEGRGQWKFTVRALDALKSAHGENWKTAATAEEPASSPQASETPAENTAAEETTSASQVSEVFAQMVHDFLVTKIDENQEIVLDETLMGELCSTFGMSTPNILTVLMRLEEIGHLHRRVRKMEDKGIRLLVNGSHFAPKTASLAPSLVTVPVVHQPASEEVVESIDSLSSHATTMIKLLRAEIRREEEIIREAEYRKNRAHELLHALGDFIET